MPNLKDIKLRIKSIKNTQKITQAMKMVAAAKVKKAENAVKSARPFSDAITTAFHKVYALTEGVASSGVSFSQAIENYPELLSRRKIKTIGLLVVSSDKGLAGAYNANIVRKTISYIHSLKEQNKKVKLFIIGQKGINGLEEFCKKENIEIINTYVKVQEFTVSSANLIIEEMAEKFIDKEIDAIQILTTKFKTMLSYEPCVIDVLPILEQSDQENTNKIDPEMLFEPTPEAVLKKIIPMYLSNSIFQAILEAQASELASRMTAMSNATNNADDMIRTLTIDYNKARQGAITQEISEVVSGANALKG